MKLVALEKLSEFLSKQKIALEPSLRYFLNESLPVWNELAQACQSEHSLTIEKHSRSLKELALRIHANPLASLCEQLEERGRIADLSDIEEISVEIAQCYSQTRDFIENELQTLSQLAC